MLTTEAFLTHIITDEPEERLYPIHPGYILEDFNINSNVLIRILQCSLQEANGIMNGIYPISKIQAFILDKFTNMSCNYWYNLQLEYEKRIIEFRQWQRKQEIEGE